MSQKQIKKYNRYILRSKRKIVKQFIFDIQSFDFLNRLKICFMILFKKDYYV